MIGTKSLEMQRDWVIGRAEVQKQHGSKIY